MSFSRKYYLCILLPSIWILLIGFFTKYDKPFIYCKENCNGIYNTESSYLNKIKSFVVGKPIIWTKYNNKSDLMTPIIYWFLMITIVLYFMNNEYNIYKERKLNRLIQQDMHLREITNTSNYNYNPQYIYEV